MMMLRRFGLIGHNVAFRRLWAGRTISMVGSTAALYALLLYLAQTGATPTRVGGVLVARALPLGLGPLAGTLADRVDSRRLMVAADLGQAVAIGAIALLLPPYWILVALVAAYSLFATLFLPAGKSAIPVLVTADQLTRANALMSASLNLALAAGPAIGAFLVAGPGPRAAFTLDAATFLISAILISRLPRLSRHAGTGPSAPFFSEFGEGIRYLIGHPVARAIAAGLFLSVAFAALDNVGLVFMVTDTLKAGERAFGLAGTIYGVAMILAPLAVLRFRPAVNPRNLLLAGLAMSGAGLALGGLSTGIGVFLAVYFMAGAGNGIENVASDTLIATTVSSDKLGRIFGAVYTPIFLADALAAAFGGVLLAATSPRVVFLVAGVGVLMILLLVSATLPRSHTRG